MVVISGPLCQRIRTVGLVLWIDANTFATSLLEKVFKRLNLPFYTLSSVEDFSYLVDDLKPQLLVLDSKTASSNIDILRKQYEGSEGLRKLPVILIDEDEIPFIENAIGRIKRPFDPFKIPDTLKNILQAK
jgi:hypothetical protein